MRVHAHVAAGRAGSGSSRARGRGPRRRPAAPRRSRGFAGRSRTWTLSISAHHPPTCWKCGKTISWPKPTTSPSSSATRTSPPSAPGLFDGGPVVLDPRDILDSGSSDPAMTSSTAAVTSPSRSGERTATSTPEGRSGSGPRRTRSTPRPRPGRGPRERACR